MTKTGVSASEAKRQRREAARAVRHEGQRRRETRRRGRSLAIYGGSAVAVIATIGLIAWSAARPRPGEKIAGQGAAHIGFRAPHPAYNSNPPTSGWHTPQTIPWGTSRTEAPDELILHNLEHGGVWISYKDPRDVALVEKLEALASRYPSKVLVTPRPQNDSAIAVAAWERLLKLDAFDERRVVEFIDAFRNRGPERVPN